jgi:hypothetical protein
MRPSGTVGRVRSRYPERQDSSLHLSAQPVEFLEFAIVIPHECRRKPDAALSYPGEATHRGERAAVADGWYHTLVQDRTIGEAVHAMRKVLPDTCGDIVTPTDDNIGPERLHQLMIGLGRVGNHGQPIGLRKLYDVAAIGARGAGYSDRLAWLQPEQVERLTRRQSVHG